MPSRTRSILLGALVTALLSTSYLGLINCLCCAGVVIGSMTAVWHYTRTNRLTIEAGQGAVLGLAAAALGGVIALLVNYVLTSAGLGGSEVIYESIIGAFEGVIDPGQFEALEEQMETQIEQQRELSFGAYVVNGLLSVFIYSLFGAVGGAVAAAIFKPGGDAADTGW